MKTSSYDEPCEEEENSADETQYGNYETTSAQQNYEPFAQTYETPLAETSKERPAESNEPSVESYQAPVANVIQQQNTPTPSEPPPVPKRTLLPSNTSKETNVASVTSQHQETSIVTEEIEQTVTYRDIELVSPEEITQKTEAGAERWSDCTSVSLPGQVEDIETISSDPGNAQCDPTSEMYYTASSEISLLSDTELPDKVQNEDEESKDDRKNVIAGHVAAMRERFESMTRTNTPCPDLIRSLSPSLEVFRNTSPSPDRLA